MSISPSLLAEFRVILKEVYGEEPTEAEAKEMAENILRLYGHLERLSNRFQ